MMTQLHEKAQTKGAEALQSMSPDQFQNWYSQQIDLARQITEPLVKAVSNGRIDPMHGAKIASAVFYGVLNPGFDEAALLTEVQRTLTSVSEGDLSHSR